METNENMLESWLVMWTQHTRKLDPSTMLTSRTCRLMRKIELIREIFLSSVKMLNQLREDMWAWCLHRWHPYCTCCKHCSQRNLQQVIIDIIDDCGIEAAFLLRGSRKKLHVCNSFLHVKVKTESVTQPCADGPSVLAACLHEFLICWCNIIIPPFWHGVPFWIRAHNHCLLGHLHVCNQLN